MNRLTVEGFRGRYGPWAVVTGASSGIGRACAVELAAAGVNLVLVARREPELAELAAELASAHGVVADVLAIDLADPTAAQWVADRTADRDVGLLVQAAGFGAAGPLLDLPLDEQVGMLRVNAEAVLVLGHLFGQRLRARPEGGGIVLFGSLLGRQGAPGAAQYGATKAYVQAFGEALHRELGPHGVDVLTATPGPVRTGFADRAGMRFRAALAPDRVARAVLAGLPAHRMTTSPGVLAKVLTALLGPLPRQLRTRIMARVLATMGRPALIGQEI